ncbi:peptide ABC transporter substrate-binding protein [Corynebacterium caspium]|uniref:peptide ABC transporter substrate-binding protein n=1 Tax=Corynebacterium caspium TaxID=234828 RepID=UPI000369D155|nr:ABC transporter substrate-binding protein [Corynebacterium caspium]WKD59531.1 Oligopeptide-binding protein OppA precursor [Corynebacterium caspium DSM 44850]
MGWKKTLSIAAVAALPLTMVACSDKGGSTSSAEGANYVLANSSEPQNPLIPSNTNEVGGGRLIDILFAGLYTFDADGNLVNEVAESVETTDSQLYTVKIKEGKTFTDGTPVTAESFVKAWNYAVANDFLGTDFFEPIKGYADGVDSLDGLKIVDDHTFTIELAQPEADFPLRLAYSAFYPLPEAAYADMKAFGENPIGNGPYKLSEWRHNESATLVPNPDYDGARPVKNDGIKFVFYPTQESAYSDLLAGNLDVLDAIPDSAFATFKDELGERAVQQPVAVFQSFTVGSYADHFSGEEGYLRRQAISMAFDRQQIIDTIFNGSRKPARDFTAPVLPGFDGNLKGSEVLEYNPAKAKELWAKADAISPFTGSFTIAYNSDGGHQAWVDAVTNQIRNTLGIEAIGEPYPDFKSLRDDVSNHRMKSGFRTGWQADYPSLGNFLSPLYSVNGGSNDGLYNNPAFDALLVKAAGAASPQESAKIYNEAQEILLQDLPAIPMWYGSVSGGYSKNVSDVVFNWRSVPEYTQITKK